MRLILNFLFKGYRILSPAFHSLSHTFGYPGQCRFSETCSEFAQRQIRENPNSIKAVGLILRRLALCNPLIPQRFFRL